MGFECPPPLLSLFSTWSAGGRDDRPNLELIGHKDDPSARRSTLHRTLSSAGTYCRGYLLTLWDPWLTAQTRAQVLRPSVPQVETSWYFPVRDQPCQQHRWEVTRYTPASSHTPLLPLAHLRLASRGRHTHEYPRNAHDACVSGRTWLHSPSGSFLLKKQS